MKKFALDIIPAFAPASALESNACLKHRITRPEMLCDIQNGWQAHYNAMAGLDKDGSLTEIVEDELRAAKAVMNALFYVDIRLTTNIETGSRHVWVVDLAHRHIDKNIPYYIDTEALAETFTELQYALASWADPNPALEILTDYLASKNLPTHLDTYMACIIMASFFYDRLGIPADERDEIDKRMAACYIEGIDDLA